MSEKQCSLCGIVEADDISLPWFPGHTCSPKCARTKAIVEAIQGIQVIDAKMRQEIVDRASYALVHNEERLRKMG